MNGIWALALLLALGLAGDAKFEAARTHYNEFEYEKAVVIFRKLVEEPGRSFKDRAKLHSWIGLCYAQMGRNKKAMDAFDRAVGYYPDVMPPPDSPPKVLELMEQSRKKVGGSAPVVKKKKRRRAARNTPPPDPHDVANSLVPTDANPSGGDGGDNTQLAGTDGTDDNSTSSDIQTIQPPPAEVNWHLVGAGSAVALGLVSLAGTGAFGALALGKKGEADEAVFQDDAFDRLEEARFNATLANVLLGTGVLLIGAGAGIWGYSLVEGS